MCKLKEAEELLKKGSDALAQGNTLSALSYFEKAVNIDNSPIISSYYAFCIAKARGQVIKAISLCEEAIKKEPQNSLHYLNLGRIYLITNNREDAIKIFREGLNYEANQQIVDELNRLVTREPSIVPFLRRSNQISKYLGITLSSNKRLRIRYTLMTLLLLVTVAFILLILFIPEKQKILAPRPGEYRKENLVDVKHDTAHTLELIAEDKTWVFVKIDDVQSKDVLLNQGEHIKWSAKNDFSLKIGNAGGIKMIFDGKEVGPLGEKGQVLSLELPSPKISKRDILGSTIKAE